MDNNYRKLISLTPEQLHKLDHNCRFWDFSVHTKRRPDDNFTVAAYSNGLITLRDTSVDTISEKLLSHPALKEQIRTVISKETSDRYGKCVLSELRDFSTVADHIINTELYKYNETQFIVGLDVDEYTEIMSLMNNT